MTWPKRNASTRKQKSPQCWQISHCLPQHAGSQASNAVCTPVQERRSRRLQNGSPGILLHRSSHQHTAQKLAFLPSQKKAESSGTAVIASSFKFAEEIRRQSDPSQHVHWQNRQKSWWSIYRTFLHIWYCGNPYISRRLFTMYR